MLWYRRDVCERYWDFVPSNTVLRRFSAAVSPSKDRFSIARAGESIVAQKKDGSATLPHARFHNLFILAINRKQ